MQRVDIHTRQPAAYQAMAGLEDYLATSSVPKDLQELIRVRASLLNQCRFCIRMHSGAAKAQGVSDSKLAALTDWQQSNLFNSREQALLAMTDSITNIREQGLPDAVYQRLTTWFSEDEIVQLIVLAATINAWNRIGVATAS